jgi:hypothetical protein
MALTARLHPRWVGGRTGYVYSVVFDGKLIVDQSANAEFDAARALLAMGHTGRLTILDGKTGRARLTLDIEKAATLTVREDARRGPCFVQWKPMPQTQKGQQSDEGEGYSPETGTEAA